MTREPATVFEIDFDYCGRTYGVLPCVASLSLPTPRKCFNGYKTCQDRANFLLTKKTIRFCYSEGRPFYNLGTVFPTLVDVSETSASVNIAGGDERLSALGERAKISVRINDFVYHDRLMDKYWAERQSGTAQIDEPGYDPGERGTFFTKLLARFPYASGREMRILEGFVDTGEFIEVSRRHYYIDEIGIPDEKNEVTIKGKDVLEFVSDDKSVAPRTSTGVLSLAIGPSDSSFTILPAGVGDVEYPTSGRVRIGGELIAFTRSGDFFSVTRGVRGTQAASHSSGDTVQLVLAIVNMRVDDYIEMLMLSYANNIKPSFIPKLTKWKPEIDRWAPGLLISTDITAPTGVATLIGELASLGFIISWSAVKQEIGLKVNRPVDQDSIYKISDVGNIISISAEKRDDDRLSRVSFYTIQRDATKNLTDRSNYDVVILRIDTDAESPLEYGVPKIKSLFVRYFNNGANTQVPVLAKRLLNRFRDPPTIYRIELDKIDDAIDLVDVLEMDSTKVTDDTGKPIPARLQVIRRTETRSGSRFEVLAQAYQYAGRYGAITENTRLSYHQSLDSERLRGTYLSNDGKAFSDGEPAYRFI